MMLNSAGGANVSESAEKWEISGVVVDAIVLTSVGVSAWVVLSFVVYGTKTRRWRAKPGSSSLSSGMSYVFCTIAMFSTIPLLVGIEIINQHPRISASRDMCKNFVDGQATAYFASIYVTYLFMWFLQRRIYQHPCVKERISKWMKYLSIVVVILLTASFAAICAVYNTFGKYRSEHGVCFFNSSASEKLAINLVSAAFVVTLQCLLLWSAIYAAIRARFPSTKADQDYGETTSKSGGYNWKILYRWFHPSDSKAHFGPVEKTVRRMVAYSLIIIGTDVIAVLVDVVILPMSYPVSLHVLGYGLSGVINVFCAGSIFGYSEKVLSLCCPKRQERQRSRFRSDQSLESVDITNEQ